DKQRLCYRRVSPDAEPTQRRSAKDRDQCQRRQQLLEIMRKEITTRADANRAGDQPADEKRKPFALSSDDQGDQTHRGKDPDGCFCPGEPCQSIRAKLKAVRPRHRADVFQVVGEYVVDELAKPVTHSEVNYNQSSNSE